MTTGAPCWPPSGIPTIRFVIPGSHPSWPSERSDTGGTLGGEGVYCWREMAGLWLPEPSCWPLRTHRSSSGLGSTHRGSETSEAVPPAASVACSGRGTFIAPYTPLWRRGTTQPGDLIRTATVPDPPASDHGGRRGDRAPCRDGRPAAGGCGQFPGSCRSRNDI